MTLCRVLGFPSGSMDKESACNAGESGSPGPSVRIKEDLVLFVTLLNSERIVNSELLLTQIRDSGCAVSWLYHS